ncbi:MAG: hypothetical protein II160_04190, partial [Selenomonas sp.]|nr:hypothetical protein [Selenomonas sp.]
GELIVQNTGTNGLTVNGEIENTGDTTMYNKAGNLTVSSTGSVKNNNGVLYISNAGNKLDIKNGAEITGCGRYLQAVRRYERRNL